jgi:Ca2+-dependent lipid-binding protein
VKIKVGQKIVGTTNVIRFTLSPEWREEFQIPLLHLFSIVTFEIWDHDEVRAHKMLGKVELHVEILPIDGEPAIYESGLQKGETYIEPRGKLFYSASIKVNSPHLFSLTLHSQLLS